ncbi:MAG: tyrosine--tRNA ligase [Candidatus Auribacterota bacterium]|nr:tyrosine--tRNA ligase [Candidatus Auribacterota bacterium]
MKTVDQQIEIIRRGAVQIIPEDELREKIKRSIATGEPLRVKYGADPSAPDIHLGHTVPLRKLREFQDLGHLVVFIIGDFTALVGDPSGKSKTRKRLSSEEIMENARTYQEQVFKILDREKTEVVYNSSWLSSLTFPDVIDLTSRYTVARMLERDDFSKRYKSGKPISVMEFLYPLMQGYDSVAVKSDVELGGTDQIFNLLVARDIQKEYGETPQAIVTLPLLEGTDGVQKMSKSLGNYVGVNESAGDIYGKLMSISDDLMWRYFELLSARGKNEIEEAKEECSSGTNPMVWKKKLAYEIAERFSSPTAAKVAAEKFELVHQKKRIPEDIAVVQLGREIGEDEINIITLLRRAGLVESNSEARRKLREGAVSINDEKIFEHSAMIAVKDNDIIRLGKRNFRKLSLT